MGNEFLSNLFGTEDGYVYSPVKDPKWKQHFFKWPESATALEEHVAKYDGRDVYISPVLFTTDRIAPETFKGSNYLWTEFDGKVPKDVIEPSMRVQSSKPGHEHWYWRLNEFVTDKNILEDLTRRIAFHYGADPSCWDYQQVLRPPNTWNYKRNKPVTLVNDSKKLYSVNDFLHIPIPPSGTKVSVELGELPSRDLILAKYRFTVDALDLLFKDIMPGKRSDALTRMAYECIESGLSNAETYVILLDRDNLWGKFAGRADQQRQLEGIISYVRGKKALTVETVPDTTSEVFKFYDFMHTEFHMTWAIQDLLPVAGSMVIFGKPGLGKSTFSLRMGMDLALGKPKFLNWDIVTRQRVLFVSLEMQHAELKQFIKDMQIPEDQQQQLQEWFHFWPLGHAYPLDVPEYQGKLLEYIDMHKIDVIIIDSLSLSMYGSVKDDDAVKKLNSFLNEDVRKKRKCGYIFIHHPRKGGIEDNKKMQDQDDMFGSMYIAANAQTVMLLTQKVGSVRLNIKLVKTRMTQGQKDFDVERTPDRGFMLVGSNAIGSGETTTHEKPNVGILGQLG